MTETTEPGRRKNPDGPAAERQRRVRLIAAALMLGGAIVGYASGRLSGRLDISTARESNQLLQTENQNFKAQISNLNAKMATMQAQLNSAQAALNAILPVENTYNIVPNQSLIVGDGHLTIGLVGPPSNEGIIVNVNGAQHSLAAGDGTSARRACSWCFPSRCSRCCASPDGRRSSSIRD